ncbi:MAG: insulinase family protein [Bacteroidetes bacterium]|nr:insulinase family protein [Bacteroidota bacterium]
MNKTIKFLSLLLAILIIPQLAYSQKKYTFESVENDPLNARIYTLENGLKVYLSVYKNEPRIQTAIAVRSGGMNDPAENTGLSHYLEHLMFKGTSKYGSLNWEKEKVYLDKIDSLYEVHSKLTDAKERAELYKIIDAVSYEASKYAIPNEYDRMLSILGARGTNAYTSLDETVYINDVPSNQLERWLMIESERFSNPVFRLFHTELETVYEEKNISLDNDGRKQMETLMLALYPNHPYGTQTVLGSQEHLKNPSIIAIRNYFNARYVPNNMAIVMSGDFDPDQLIVLIDKYFGKMQPRPLQDYNFPAQPEVTLTEKEVFGPQAENVMFGFKFSGVGTQENEILSIVNMILSNQRAGLIDLNINQAQKTLGSGSWIYNKNQYAAHMFSGSPKQGQSLEEVRDLLLAEIENLKKGNFEDWLLPAAINNLKIRELRGLQSNNGRNNAMVNSFVKQTDWADYVKRFERLEKITKQDIIDFANKYYGDNYVVVYKRKGKDENILKIEKPQITPVVINRDVESDFFKTIAGMKAEKIEPVFIDYKKDINHHKVGKNIPMLYQNNDENSLFTLYYVLEMGNNHDPLLSLAISYLEYLGTNKYTPAAINQEFYKLGSNFNVNSGDDRSFVFLSGLEENFDKSLILFEHLLANCEPNEEALENLKRDIIRSRENSKLDKRSIFWNALYNYGLYGENSPLLRQISNEELMKVTSDQLISRLRKLTSYEHKVLYYGVREPKALSKTLAKHHKVPKKFLQLPEEKFYDVIDREGRTVFVVDYDMKQVDLLLFSKAAPFQRHLNTQINVFNEYFGGGMSSIVFQELREAKGLAYSAFASFTNPSRVENSHVIYSFIGTQNDKLYDALSAMNDLMINMPVSESSFSAAKEAITERIRTQRISRASILFNYINAQKMGYETDIRKELFETVPGMDFKTLQEFQNKYVKGNEFNVLVLGKKDELNLEVLEKFGKIQFLTLEEIFGF